MTTTLEHVETFQRDILEQVGRLRELSYDLLKEFEELTTEDRSKQKSRTQIAADTAEIKAGFEVIDLIAARIDRYASDSIMKLAAKTESVRQERREKKRRHRQNGQSLKKLLKQFRGCQINPNQDQTANFGRNYFSYSY